MLQPSALFSDGDIDMEVAFEDGELELVLLDEANERELEASEATLVGVPSTLEPVPKIQLMDSWDYLEMLFMCFLRTSVRECSTWVLPEMRFLRVPLTMMQWT